MLGLTQPLADEELIGQIRDVGGGATGIIGMWSVHLTEWEPIIKAITSLIVGLFMLALLIHKVITMRREFKIRKEEEKERSMKWQESRLRQQELRALQYKESLEIDRVKAELDAMGVDSDAALKRIKARVKGDAAD